MKLESLDINLNTMSMVLFFFHALFIFSMTLAIFGGAGNKKIFMSIILTFVIYQMATLYYGIETGQIGFILMVAFQFFMSLITYIYLNQAVPFFDQEDDDVN